MPILQGREREICWQHSKLMKKKIKKGKFSEIKCWRQLAGMTRCSLLQNQDQISKPAVCLQQDWAHAGICSQTPAPQGKKEGMSQGTGSAQAEGWALIQTDMGAAKEGEETMGHCGKLSHRAPGSWCRTWGTISGEPDLLLELLPGKYLLCHNTTSTPSSENLFRMENHFYSEKKNNQSLA